MACAAKLKELGWNLTDEGICKLGDDGKITDVKQIIKIALDTDFREIAGGAFPFELNKGGKIDSIPGNIVLQIVKISNVSAPKANQESKAVARLLKLELSDGQTQFPGLEFESITALSLTTPPGTKVLLKNGPISISNGFLLFGPKNIEILGGRVIAMIEKWETIRALSKFSKSVVKPNTGAPSWNMFGKTIEGAPDDKSFKSFTPEQEKENAEFNAMRKEAIEEAIKLQTNKEFGGGKVRIIDHNIQKIVDKGYTVDQAKFALKISRNNLERAFSSLKRQNENKSKYDNNNESMPSGTRGGRDGGDLRRNSREDRFSRKGKPELEASKPSGKLSLYDFLEDKLPQVLETAVVKTNSYQTPLAKTSLSSTTKPLLSKSNITTTNNKYPVFPQTATSSKNYKDYKENNSSNIHNTNNTSSHKLSDKANSTAYDRSKFENNISASFRQKKDIPSHAQSGKHFNTQDSSRPSIERTMKGTNFAINKNSISSNYKQTPVNNNRYINNNNSNQIANNRQQSIAQSNIREASPPKSKELNSNNNNNNNQNRVIELNSGAKITKNSNQNFNQYEKNRAYKSQNPTSYNTSNNHHSNNFNNSNISNSALDQKIQQLTDQTAKIHIANSNVNHNATSKKTVNQPLQEHQKQQQTLTPNTFTKAFPQASNGYGYNPYKIVGFQNKEANEFAMNVLRTQQPPNFNVGQQQQQHPPPQQKHQKQQMNALSSHVFAQAPPNYSHQQTHGPIAEASGFSWKTGDRVLAKYWEDGRYYQAEVTGVSERTIVVNFLEYGNFEEVLKADIVPFSHDIMNQQHNMYNNSMKHQNIQRGNPGRYREERPHYVPPAQRTTK